MNIDGTSGPDSLAGTDGADSIRGFDGDDTLNGLNGDDTVLGGAGNDLVRGEEFDLDPWSGMTPTGDDVLDGGGGDDTVFGGNGADRITGGGGDDAIAGDDYDLVEYDGVTPTGDDTIDGGGGADRIDGGGGQDLVLGGIGDDVLSGAYGVDTLFAGIGNDTLDAFGGAFEFGLGSGVDGDRMYGEDGDDLFRVGRGGRSVEEPGRPYDVLRLDGGAGRDVIEFAAGSILNIYLDQDAPADAANVIEARRIEAIVVNPFYGHPGAANVFGSDAGGRLQLDEVRSFHGGDSRDLITGIGAFDDERGVVYGGGGDDLIVLTGAGRVDGGEGDDVLRIERGEVSYETASSAVTVALGIKGAQDTGGAGVDVVAASGLWGSAFDDQLTASSKTASLRGLAGSDTLIGGASGDFLSGGSSADILNSGGGRDNLFGGDGDDSLSGGDGTDDLNGGAGADSLLGGAGDDTLDGAVGNDLLDGGEGIDRVAFADATTGVTVDFARTDRQTTSLGRDIYLGIEHATGSFHDDRLFGNAAANELYGWTGDDLLRGRAADDVLTGGYGDDTLDGGDGDDMLYDTQPQYQDEPGHGVYSGGAGVDHLDWFNNSSHDVTIDLAVKGMQEVMPGVTLSVDGIENLTTWYSDDHLLGTSGANRLNGGSGYNTLNGRGGDDVLVANADPSDTNIYIGGGGFDIIDASVTGYGRTYDFGQQPLKFQGVEGVVGSWNGDRLTAGASAVRFEGGLGTDTLKGGDGADTLIGGAGKDRLIGAAGADDLAGGGHADTFSYLAIGDSGATTQTADLIRDFDAGEGDVVSLEKIDAIAGTAANEAFHFVDAFTGAAGEARLTYIAARQQTMLDLDVDGDAASDMLVIFRGLVNDDAGWVL